MVASSAIPDRVPLGFICGYPVGSGGELYGGSYFTESAAKEGLQSQAIKKADEKWGTDCRNIGLPVCKKKYRPFEFLIKRTSEEGEVGCHEIKVSRLYGCPLHSHLRKEVIERHGERYGWEPFGQWSISKARAAARREQARLNYELRELYEGDRFDVCSVAKSVSSSESEDDELPSLKRSGSRTSLSSKESPKQKVNFSTLCDNGVCTWKRRGKVDDIAEEIEEERG